MGLMRLARIVGPLAQAVLVLLGGCKRGQVNRAASSDASAPRSAEAPLTTDAALFSAPIGAARSGNVDVVAGLVAADGTVRLVGLAESGPSWSADALHGVAWAPDAELRVQAAAGGFTVFWRGLRDRKATRTLVLVGPRGELRGPPIEIGASFCATADGVAWVGAHAAGASRVVARRWSESASREVVTVPRGRDASLVCGDHKVIVLAEGEDDISASTFVPGDATAQPPIVVSRDSDFRDDEREHDAYSIGDDLGLVRVAASGAVAVRELSEGHLAPWRRLEHTLSSDEDIVAVDGDPASTLIVATRDSEDACPDSGSTSESVRAIRIDRRTGQESLVDVAPPDCERMRGPFWIGQATGGAVVAWVERRTEAAPKSAAISGMAFRVLTDGGVRTGRIEQPADAFVNAGCDEHRCAAVALVREPGTDGMRPAPIRVFAYP
jgi:hypothetical protein